MKQQWLTFSLALLLFAVHAAAGPVMPHPPAAPAPPRPPAGPAPAHAAGPITAPSVAPAPGPLIVASIPALQTAIDHASPGDTILLASGIYPTAENIIVSSAGTQTHPILIAAQTPGAAEITGTGGFDIQSPAAHIIISGFKFTHAASKARTGPGTSFCRFTRNIFATPGDGEDLTIAGDDQEVDHNSFRDKDAMGRFLAIRGSGHQIAQRLWIHHNYFANFKSQKGNGAEALQFGLSGFSLSSSNSVVEFNLFEDCAGENELISVKASVVTLRYNTIRNCPAQFTLRHGNKSLVYGNYFINTPGIRIFGDDHSIYSNCFQHCNPAITIGNGDGEVADGAQLTAHDRPDRVLIAYNTLVDNEVNITMTPRKEGMGATFIAVAGNIISGGGPAAVIRGPYTNATWSGNTLFRTRGPGDMPDKGYKKEDPRLTQDAAGGYPLQKGDLAIDMTRAHVLSPRETGPAASAPASPDASPAGPAGAPAAAPPPTAPHHTGPYPSPTPAGPPAPQSEWVFLDPHHRLAYKPTERGDKIMDFSYAGYGGGGIRIPTVETKITVSPQTGDNTGPIQRAIDEVSLLPLVNGFRGAVLLQPGEYSCDRPIMIQASGVVLRGSGAGPAGSVIKMTGTPHVCIEVKGAVTTRTIGTPAAFSAIYVPAGALSFRLTDASGFQTGDTIRITRPVTEAWVKFMGMDQLIRDGKKQTWVSGEISCERVITQKTQNIITVDVPLTDSYDRGLLDPPGVTVTKISTSGELSQIGIENFRIVCPAQAVTINDGHHRAFTMSGLTDGWARKITVLNTVNSISITGKRITVEDIGLLHDSATLGAAKPADINGSGPQLLFHRCTSTCDNVFFFGTGAKVTGPIVLLNCVFHGHGWIQPHQRWATGLLIDDCEVPEGGIDFMNRGEMGSGHGWAIGWAVAWNCRAKSYLNQQPPGAVNWVIGCSGEKQQGAMPFEKAPLLPEGIYDSYGQPVAPKSLYLAQLRERLGEKALANIGYPEDARAGQ